MITRRWKMILKTMAVLAVCANLSWAQQPAVTIDMAWNTVTYEPGGGILYGWMFRVTQDIIVTDLGLYDVGGDGLTGTWNVGIWKYVAAPGQTPTGWAIEPVVTTTIGPVTGGPAEGSCHYVPVQSAGGPVVIPYVPVTPGSYDGCYFLGFWFAGTSPDSRERLLLSRPAVVRAPDVPFPPNPPTASWPVPASGIIPASGPWNRPYGTSYDCAVNFKYSLGPMANAGPDSTIFTCEQAITTIAGSANHLIAGTPMTYRWLKGEAELQASLPVGGDGAAPLNLAPLDLGIGVHTLTLEVTDNEMRTCRDSMQLTVTNSPPSVIAAADQVVQVGLDPILLEGSVADFDGDELTYEWVTDTGEVLGGDTVPTLPGGGVIDLAPLVIPAGDSGFPLGEYEVWLVVHDSANGAVSDSMKVNVKDTTAPSLGPAPSVFMLWPPNHELRSVTIDAHAEDNSDGVILLYADVQSNEPPDDAGDGSTEVDCVLGEIDYVAGTIPVQLRAERSGTGEGRVYTITITATDGSGNQSTAAVNICVPHDKRKK